MLDAVALAQTGHSEVKFPVGLSQIALGPERLEPAVRPLEVPDPDDFLYTLFSLRPEQLFINLVGYV